MGDRSGDADGKRAGSRAPSAARLPVEPIARVLDRIVGTAQAMLGGGRGISWKKVIPNQVPNLYLLIAFAEEMTLKTRGAEPST